ncbi:MAG: hypothetical protein M1812_002677 [Candelaria pacifica]|nr:MAG: hypothetical protein M1812_002677 [Candelaria pacifica]
MNSSTRKNNNGLVAIIDTTGFFDVGKLFEGVVERLRTEDTTTLRKGSGVCSSGIDDEEEENDDDDDGEKEDDGEETDGSEEMKVQEKAKRLLDRVLYMRILDFVGLVDAVKEIRDMLEGKSGNSKEGDVESQDEEGVKETEKDTEKKTEKENEEVESLLQRGGGDEEIADSEDEDAVDDDDDAEIVDTTTADSSTVTSRGGLEEKVGNGIEKEDIGLIIIDDITNVLSPIMARNQTEGN